MAVTRINNNQITDASAGNVYLGINANTKIQNFSITAGKIANNLTYGSDLTVAGNLTVQGNSTAIDTTITTIEDPVIVLASTQTGSPTVDIGFIGERGTSNNIAFVWDESSQEFITAFTDTSETSTTINVIGYANIHTLNADIDGNLTIGGNIDITGNVSNLSVTGNITGGNLLTPGLISATGNITSSANVIAANIQTSGAVDATGLIRGSNLLTAGNVSATGNVTGSNLRTSGEVSATGNITGGNIISGNAVIGNINVSGDITVNSLTANTTVSAGGTVTGGNLATGGTVSATSTVTGGNLATGGTASATGTITGGNIATGGAVSATSNITGGNLLTSGLVSATGNLTSGNVATAGNVSATGEITGGNIFTGGLISATGAITGGSLETAGTANVTGTITGGNIQSNGFLSAVGTATVGNLATAGTVSSTGNVTGGNVNTGGLISSVGNVIGGNISTAGLVTATGNVTGGNITTSGIVSATSNIKGANVETAQVYGATTLTLKAGTGNINLDTTGNIVLANTFINGVAQPVQDQDAASKIYVDNLVTTAISYHEQVVAATNTTLATATGGTISYTQPNGVSNGVGAYIQTTGSFTTIDTANVQTLGTRILVKDEGNAVLNGVYVYSNATAITRASTEDTYGPATANALSINDYFFVTSGNVNAGSAWIVDSPNGVITFGTSNIQFAQFSQSQVYSANTAAGLSLIGTVFSAKVDNNTTAFDGLGNISVKAGANLTTPNIGAATGTSLSTTGTITGGNLATGGTASATGTITGGNLATGGTASATGTITGGNIATGGTVSATGNLISGNVNTGGLVSATGDVTGANLITGGLVTSTGNITGGNVLTSGLVSSTGTVTGGNLATGGTISGTGTVTGGNIATGGTVSSTGTVTGGNIATGGTVSSTGNITGGNILTGGQVSATGNIFAANFIGNIQGNIDAGGSNTQVQFNDGDILNGTTGFTFDKTSNAVTVVGTITGGNLATGGTVSATGTATLGNVATGGTVSATGNVISGNVNTGGQVSATGNIFGGNIDTGGSVLASANVVGNNIVAISQLTGGNIVIQGDDITNEYNTRVNFNSLQTDVDFAVNGDTVANVFYVDAGTGTASFGSATQTVNAIVAFNATNSFLAPVGNTGQRPSVGVTGMVRFNTTNNNLELYDNSAWTAVGVPEFTVISNEQFYGDGSTVAFTLGSTQTTNSCIVSINGVVQIPITAYSVSGIDPTCVLTFTEAPDAADVIDVREITTTTTVTAISNLSGNAVVAVSDTSATTTITGDLVVTGNATITGNVATNQIQNGSSAVQIPTANGNVNFDINGADNVYTFGQFNMLAAANITPTANVTYDLGTTTQRWKDLYLANSTIYLGNAQISANTTSLILTNPQGGQTILSGATSAITGASVSVTGNITGNYILGNGSQLTGIDATSIQNGTSSVSVIASGGNVRANIAGATVTTTYASGLAVTGLVSATGTVTGGNIVTAGLVSATGTITGGNINCAGNVGITGSLLVSGVPPFNSVAITGATISAAGNVTGGNLLTAGLISATGNITGGNILINGSAVITGNLNVQGTETIFNVGNITVNDKDIIVANNVTGGANVDGAGIQAGNPATATWFFNNATTSWQSNIGITPTTNGTLSLGGASNYWGSAFVTNVSLTGNIIDSGALTISTGSNGNITLAPNGTGNVNIGGNIMPTANATANIGSATLSFNTIFAKATSAQYADLAEKYTADAEYAPGTVLVFGGTHEVTVNAVDSDRKVAGVVSTNPSYIMNAGLEAEHVATVALTGRVPCMVVGTVRKGDMMVTAGLGRARAEADPQVGTVIGKALEDFDGTEGTIEVVVGRF
jgi:hypothetical protein